MNVECVSTYDGFLRLEAEWSRVQGAASHDHVCFTFAWFRSWWDAFGDGKKLHILIFRDEDAKAVAIAPCMIQRRRIAGLPVRMLTFIYDNTASRCDIIIARGHENAVIRDLIAYAAGNHSGWDMVRLENIRDDSMSSRLLPLYIGRRGFRYSVQDGLCSPYIGIESDWPEYFSGFSKKFHKSYRNIRNRMAHAGTHHIVDHRVSDRDIIRAITNISSRSWKSRYKADIASDAKKRLFFELLSGAAGKQGWLHIWMLVKDNQPVAYEYALEYKNRLYSILADFDEGFRELSCGALLNAHVIRYCFDKRLTECDLCGHDDAYKKRWTDRARNHRIVTMYSKGPYGFVLYILDHVIYARMRRAFRRIRLLRVIKNRLRKAG